MQLITTSDIDSVSTVIFDFTFLATIIIDRVIMTAIFPAVASGRDDHGHFSEL